MGTNRGKKMARTRAIACFTAIQSSKLGLDSAGPETRFLKSEQPNRHAFDAHACQVGGAFEVVEPLNMV
jgi:hypothetical protein